MPSIFRFEGVLYLLFLDESGTHDDSPVTIVAGIAVHEQDAWHLQRRLSRVLEQKLPRHLDPLDFELHAAEMKSPNRGRGRRPSAWDALDYPSRMAILDAAYRTLGGYTPQSLNNPVVLFGAVVTADYADQLPRAYEKALHKFDEMLTRRGHEAGQPHERGLALHDKAIVEGDLQEWTNLWRQIARSHRCSDSSRGRALWSGGISERELDHGRLRGLVGQSRLSPFPLDDPHRPTKFPGRWRLLDHGELSQARVSLGGHERVVERPPAAPL